MIKTTKLSVTADDFFVGDFSKIDAAVYANISL